MPLKFMRSQWLLSHRLPGWIVAQKLGRARTAPLARGQGLGHAKSEQLIQVPTIASAFPPPPPPHAPNSTHLMMRSAGYAWEWLRIMGRMGHPATLFITSSSWPKPQSTSTQGMKDFITENIKWKNDDEIEIIFNFVSISNTCFAAEYGGNRYIYIFFGRNQIINEEEELTN